jgi:hypothetical protein
MNKKQISFSIISACIGIGVGYIWLDPVVWTLSVLTTIGVVCFVLLFTWFLVWLGEH